jgi:hypothetical protein
MRGEIPIPQDWRRTAAAYCCWQSHLAAIRSALNDQLESLLILEDDAAPVAGLADAWNALQGPLRRLKWDMLYLGGRPPGGRPVAARLVEPFIVYGSHAYILRPSAMRYIVSIAPTIHNFHDHVFGVLHKQSEFRTLCVHPWLFTIRPEVSDTRMCDNRGKSKHANPGDNPTGEGQRASEVPPIPQDNSVDHVMQDIVN